MCNIAAAESVLRRILGSLGEARGQEREGEGASLAETRTLGPDPAAHRFYQRLGDGQSDAGAAHVAVACSVDSEKALEQVGHVLFGDADSRIAYTEGDLVCLWHGAN